MVFALRKLDRDMLVRILKEPKNAILKQYQKLLELDEVRLDFNEGALEAIADEAKAIERARALAGEDGVVLVCGSLYLAGDVRLMLRDDKGKI